jgi:hypothetical protein
MIADDAHVQDNKSSEFWRRAPFLPPGSADLLRNK